MAETKTARGEGKKGGKGGGEGGRVTVADKRPKRGRGGEREEGG